MPCTGIVFQRDGMDVEVVVGWVVWVVLADMFRTQYYRGRGKLNTVDIKTELIFFKAGVCCADAGTDGRLETAQPGNMLFSEIPKRRDITAEDKTEGIEC